MQVVTVQRMSFVLDLNWYRQLSQFIIAHGKFSHSRRNTSLIILALFSGNQYPRSNALQYLGCHCPCLRWQSFACQTCKTVSHKHFLKFYNGSASTHVSCYPGIEGLAALISKICILIRFKASSVNKKAKGLDCALAFLIENVDWMEAFRENTRLLRTIICCKNMKYQLQHFSEDK